MEHLMHHHWWHILVAAIGYFALGAVWYGPIFGKQWVKLCNINMDDPNAKKGVAAIMFGSFICMVLSTLALEVILHRLMIHHWLGGLKWGVFLGVMFNSSAISINYLYNKKPLMLYIIDCAYQTIGLGIAGVILAYWR